MHGVLVQLPRRDFEAKDPAVVDGIFTILLRPDARAWVYGYIRNLSNLYVVEGLS